MADLAALKQANAHRWAVMKLHPDRMAALQATARRLCAPDAKTRYKAIEQRSMVPWWFVAVVHEREAGGPPHWNRYLGNGQLLCNTTTEVPENRGPFLDHPADTTTDNAFCRGALDALIDCAPFAAHNKDWTPGGALTLLEQYNGLAYANHDQPSPYVWSGSDQYSVGKITHDHGPIEPIVDEQEGCAPIIACMMAFDSSIVFAGSGSPWLRPPPLPPTTSTPVPSFWSAFATALAHIFGLKR